MKQIKILTIILTIKLRHNKIAFLRFENSKFTFIL